jgi:hypothetical protein
MEVAVLLAREWPTDTRVAPDSNALLPVSLEFDVDLVTGNEELARREFDVDLVTELARREFGIGVLKSVEYRFANGSK